MDIVIVHITIFISLKHNDNTWEELGSYYDDIRSCSFGSFSASDITKTPSFIFLHTIAKTQHCNKFSGALWEVYY